MSDYSFYQDSQIELIHPGIERGRIRFALFDFDGTISLIREGWQGIMIPMMMEILLQTPEHEDPAQVEQVVREFVTRLTGKQTIYQMIQLAQEITLRGGNAQDPLVYKSMYNERLNQHIADRIDDLRAGRVMPAEMCVPGAIDWLQILKRRGVECYLASGTDEHYVLEEAELLGLTHYFAGIYGAQDQFKSFSKKMVIDRIISEHALHGSQLVAFGDGFVEIEDTKSVDGIAVGLATDEQARCGVDAWKRSRLIAAGADLIVPDFREAKHLERYLFLS